MSYTTSWDTINHRVLKEWKAEYGATNVESWLQA
ncbi:hypothetical protein ACU5P0_04685 [Pseudomonas plecoglossicida]